MSAVTSMVMVSPSCLDDGAEVAFGDGADALGADVEIGRVIVFTVHMNAHPVFLPTGQRAFFVCRRAQIEATLPRVAVGELTMPEAEKTKPETRETRPTDDGYLSPAPPKKKIIEPAVSR